MPSKQDPQSGKKNAVQAVISSFLKFTNPPKTAAMQSHAHAHTIMNTKIKYNH
jgi:hypothetical protein